MSVSYECGVLSGRGLCSGPITRSEQSYWCGVSKVGITQGYFIHYSPVSSITS